MSEIALVTARRGRLQALVDSGDAGAAAAMALNEHPTRFLSTIQVGITSIGVLSGIVGEAALAAPLAQWLDSFQFVETQTAGYLATGLVVMVVTYFAIVFGELVPKRIGPDDAGEDRAPGGAADSRPRHGGQSVRQAAVGVNRPLAAPARRAYHHG
jgi:CBS domain containing-hemolysin-like protein